jgi:hypothetical protein
MSMVVKLKLNPARAGKWLLGLVVSALYLQIASANERDFTYSYEPETMPTGAMEFEQWVTLRTQRTRIVWQENFNLWKIREELEYGVTDSNHKLWRWGGLVGFFQCWALENSSNIFWQEVKST